MILIAQELQKWLENGQTVGACDYQQKQHSYFRQHGVIDCVCVVDMMDGIALHMQEPSRPYMNCMQ